MNYQKHHRTRAKQQEGSILVVCMVLAAVGTLGVTAWISLMDARGHLVEANMMALERRTIRANGKALAYHAIYQKHLQDKNPYTSNSEYTIAGDLGQCMIMPYATAPLSEVANTHMSKNGGSPFRSFSTDLEIRTFADAASIKGTQFQSWNFQLRSYHPTLGGELLSFFPPNPAADANPLVSGSLHVKGRAVFWDAVTNDFGAGLRANEYLLPNRIGNSTTFQTVAGANTLPLNYPLPVQTSGLSGADGKLNIFDPSVDNSHNDYLHRADQIIDAETSVPVIAAPGPLTTAPTSNDAALETQIQSQSPATLVKALIPYYPLSSRVLNTVTRKNNPAFTGAQLRQVFSSHTPIPHDALANLMAVRGAQYEQDMETLNIQNSTVYLSAGNGNVWVFLNQAGLPHLYIKAPQNLYLIGQDTTARENAAASLPPRSIIVARDSSNVAFSRAVLRHVNKRRIILGIATKAEASPQAAPATLQLTSSSPFPTWCMLVENKGIPLNYDLSAVSGATIRGGIRTDSRMRVIGGTLTLERETNYSGLENDSVRTAWVEAYRN